MTQLDVVAGLVREVLDSRGFTWLPIYTGQLPDADGPMVMVELLEGDPSDTAVAVDHPSCRIVVRSPDPGEAERISYLIHSLIHLTSRRVEGGDALWSLLARGMPERLAVHSKRPRYEYQGKYWTMMGR